jgi:hypothetical protein
MRHGLSAARVSELRRHIGVSRRALERWRRWWLETFQQTPLWKTVRGRFASPVDPSRVPASLLERFAGDGVRQLVSLLELLAPLSASTRAKQGF